MTRIQVAIVAVIVAAIAVIAVPRAMTMRRISRAERDVLSIAGGFVQYRVDTEGQECQSIKDLIENPGVPGWMGPYASRRVMKENPWGGEYGVELNKQKIVIPRGDIAPDRYELGGSKEISFSYTKEMKLE